MKDTFKRISPRVLMLLTVSSAILGVCCRMYAQNVSPPGLDEASLVIFIVEVLSLWFLFGALRVLTMILCIWLLAYAGVFIYDRYIARKPSDEVTSIE